LLLVEGWRLEQCSQENNKVNTQKGELGPEEHNTEEGEVDCDTVYKGRKDRGRADILRRGVSGEFAAGLDEVFMLSAIGLFVERVGLHVAVCLRAPGSVLGSDDHGDGVVDGEGDERKEDGSHEQCLRRSMSLANLENGDPKESDTGRRNTNDRGREEEQDEEEKEDIVDGEDLGGLDEDPV